MRACISIGKSRTIDTEGWPKGAIRTSHRRNGQDPSREVKSIVIHSDQAKMNAKANVIWRFFPDDSHQWQWERLAFDRTVLGHSTSGYATYESCVANASLHGYEYLASTSTKPLRKPRKAERSFKVITKK